jgi:hypothetical protein
MRHSDKQEMFGRARRRVWMLALTVALGMVSSTARSQGAAGGVWPADQIVLFRPGFPEAVKPWATRFATAIRNEDLNDLRSFVLAGESPQSILSFWKLYGSPRHMYFIGSYDAATDLFVLADSSGKICGCSGIRSADGYRFGRCRALNGVAPSSAVQAAVVGSHLAAAPSVGSLPAASGSSRCVTTVAPGNTGPRKVILSGGTGGPLFDKYVEVVSARGAVVDFATLTVYFWNDKGAREEVTGGKPGVFQRIAGMKSKTLIRSKLESKTVFHVLNPLAEAAQLQADIVCGD